MSIFSLFQRKRKVNRSFTPEDSSFTIAKSYTGRGRVVTASQLLNEYRGTVYACANINAQVVSQTPLRLYRLSTAGIQKPGKQLNASRKAWVRANIKAVTGSDWKPGVHVEEVTEHPLVDLIETSNRDLGEFTIFEVTQLHLELVGYSYWFVQKDDEDMPETIWVLQPHLVTPKKDKRGVVEYYEYGSFANKQILSKDQVIRFSFPDPKNPYSGGYSPLRSVIDAVDMEDRYKNFISRLMDQPTIFASPKEPIGQDEADRLARKIREFFRRRDHGGIGVLEEAVELNNLDTSAQEVGIRSQHSVTKNEIANAFQVPVALLETDNVNRANAEAAYYQHCKLAVLPRCIRRDSQLTRFLCQDFYGKDLFFLSDNPVPKDELKDAEIRESRTRNGVTSINEERKEMGLPHVPWGDEPWFNSASIPASLIIERVEKELEQPAQDIEINEDQPGYNQDDPNRQPKLEEETHYTTRERN